MAESTPASQSAGRLLLVPTLLGATDPARALPQATIDAARNTRCFLAENARSARAFLKAVGHPCPIATLHIVEIGHQPEDSAIDEWLAPAFDGNDVAIVSEAGCPGVADPGASLVARAHARGLRVVALVGPSAPLLLLMAAGMDGQRFRFVGYLAQEAGTRSREIKALEEQSRIDSETQIFIETPYRNERLLAALLEALQPHTRLAVGIDLTTEAEDVRSFSIDQWRRLSSAERPRLSKRPAVFALLARAQSGRGR